MIFDPRGSDDLFRQMVRLEAEWRQDRYASAHNNGTDDYAAFPAHFEVRHHHCAVCGATFKRFKPSHNAWLCTSCGQEIHDDDK
jgi:hypothetical protein